MNTRLRLYEYIHIPFWLVKDSCWALQIKSIGLLMIFPTVILAYIICHKTWKQWLDFLPNLAILLWISANSIWMSDEFFNLGIKQLCYLPFIAGLAVISIWLIFFLPKHFKDFKS
jgi:hypothetical protein